MPLQIVDQGVLDEMLRLAADSPRRRAHRNFHESLEDPIHRLMIGAMPDTVFPIHRHKDKFELMSVLSGEMEITLYNNDGSVISKHVLGPGCPVCTMEIPAGVFHGNKILKPAVMLEVKPGPYIPIGPEDTLVIP